VLPDGRAYCSLIRPEPDWQHWEPSAETVHGIRRDVLREHGKSACQVADDLNHRLSGQTAYTDAWYHDYQWLAQLYEAAERSPSFRLQDLRDILNDHALAHWEQTRHQVLQELGLQRHRASHDARVMQLTWNRLMLGSPAD